MKSVTIRVSEEQYELAQRIAKHIEKTALESGLSMVLRSAGVPVGRVFQDAAVEGLQEIAARYEVPMAEDRWQVPANAPEVRSTQHRWVRTASEGSTGIPHVDLVHPSEPPEADDDSEEDLVEEAPSDDDFTL